MQGKTVLYLFLRNKSLLPYLLLHLSDPCPSNRQLPCIDYLLNHHLIFCQQFLSLSIQFNQSTTD